MSEKHSILFLDVNLRLLISTTPFDNLIPPIISLHVRICKNQHTGQRLKKGWIIFISFCSDPKGLTSKRAASVTTVLHIIAIGFFMVSYIPHRTPVHPCYSPTYVVIWHPWALAKPRLLHALRLALMGCPCSHLQHCASGLCKRNVTGWFWLAIEPTRKISNLTVRYAGWHFVLGKPGRGAGLEMNRCQHHSY